MKHALWSPSSSERILACHGSLLANLNKPYDENVHSLLGTSAHGLLEVCLRLHISPFVFVGATLSHGHNKVDEDMASAVSHALDWVNDYLQQNPKTKLLIEQRVYMDEALGIEPSDVSSLLFAGHDGPVCWGTSDIILDNWPVECVVADYKHGSGHAVTVAVNPQLRMYTVGQRAARGRYQRYRNVVIQPRVKGRKAIQESHFTDNVLTNWVENVVKPVIPIALSPDAPRVAGDHCKYCVADGNCEAQHAQKVASAQEEFRTNNPDVKRPRSNFKRFA